jgi:pyroglutamyl-peptidase
MYGTLYTLAKKYPGVIGGFMHVPYITEQVLDKRNMPSLTTEQIVKGIEAAIKAIDENNDSLNTIEGTTH